MIRTTQIGMSFLYNYLTSELPKEDGSDNISKKSLQMKVLSEVLAKSGGVLSKFSQIILHVHDDTDNQVFTDCTPFNPEATHEFILDELEVDENLGSCVTYFNEKVFKSGSIGQVYKAVYKDSKDIVIKVQYEGLHEQFKTDLSIVHTLMSFLLYGNSGINEMFKDIKNKLYEELDYKVEAKNHQFFYDLWKNHPYIQIPELIPEISTDKIICMEFIDGESLSEFISNSTLEEKNIIGKRLVEFVFTSLYKDSIFYSDSHYGNFIIKDKSVLYVMDFGCVHKYDQNILNKLKQLHKTMILKDKSSFYEAVTDLHILNDKVVEESKEFMYEYFNNICKPWIVDEEFEFTDEWLDLTTVKNSELIKQWSVPDDIVFLSKIPFSLSYILNKLNVKANFRELFNKLLE